MIKTSSAVPTLSSKARNQITAIEARYEESHRLESTLRHRLLYSRDCGWARASHFRRIKTTDAAGVLSKRRRQWGAISKALDSIEKTLNLEQKFQEQASKWHKETQHLSSPGQKMMHPSYQAILGMANAHRREMISLMIRDMEQHRRPWFWALSYLAQDNPVSQSDAEKMDKVIKAWVDWGKAQRLL